MSSDVSLQTPGSNAALYESRTEIRWQRLAAVYGLFLVLVTGLVPMMFVVLHWFDGRRGRHWSLSLAGPLVIAAFCGLLIVIGLAYEARRLSFVVLADRIRIATGRKPVDIPFDTVETAALLTIGPRDVLLSWHAAFSPRYVKFGVGDLGRIGRDVMVKVTCKGSGKPRGYYLCPPDPENFLSAINSAMERYRASA